MANRSEENKNLIHKERKIFASNLKKARLDAGLTQEGLVRRTNLTQAFISGIETCKTNPSMDNASRLAKAVGKTLRDLLDPQKN